MRVPMSRFVVTILAAGVSIVLTTQASSANVYYVAPGGNDSGSGTESQPFATPQGCFNRMASGDTCLFKTGTWSGGDPGIFYIPKWNVCDGPSGTAGAPTIYKAAPGHSPVFVGQPVFGASTFNNNPTCQQIRIEGLKIDGGFIMADELNKMSNVTVTGNEFIGGYDCDGNFAPIRMEQVRNVQFDHNYVHGLNMRGCVQSVGGTQLVKLYGVIDVVFEHNTFKDDGALLNNGFEAKTSPQNLIIRYNHFIRTGLRSMEDERYWKARNVQVYGNVFEGITSYGLGGIFLLQCCSGQGIDGFNAHHNTLVNTMITMDTHPDYTGGFPGFIFTDNLLHNTSENWFMAAAYWKQVGTYAINNNIYDANGTYVADGWASHVTHASLSSWRTALQNAGCAGCESNSQELVCSFTPGTDTAYRLSGGACMTASSSGGQVGAYALTNCVGHTCGASQPLRGDLDGSGKVDLDDLRRMIYMLIGTVPVDLTTADLDGDGQLLLVDLQTLVRILVGLP